MIATTLLVLNIVAAFNGLLIAAVLVFQERMGPAQIRLTFAGLLACISFLLALFIALDNGVVIYSMALGVATDVIGLVAGALFFNYVTSVSGRPMLIVAFVPVVLYLLSVLFAGGRWLAPTEIGPIVLIQTAYSLVALFIYIGARTELPQAVANRTENRLLPALFTGIGLLHSAQFLRLAFPSNSFFFDFVPFVGALGLILLVFYGVTGSQTLVGFGQAPRTPAPAKTTGPNSEIEAAILASRAFLDPDISLKKVANIVELRPRDLSAYLNQQKGLTFRDYINDLRVTEAQRILCNSDEVQTSIEAVGLLSGFRARSSFYDAFKTRTGKTPAEYRKLAR